MGGIVITAIKWHLSFFGLHFKVARMKPKRNTSYFVPLYEIKINP